MPSAKYLQEPAEPRFPPQTSATMRGQYFGFGSRNSNDSISNGGWSNSGEENLRANRNLELSASQAASEEQGNSSMCSFGGFFINITEDQLNSQLDNDEMALSPPKSTKRLQCGKDTAGSPTMAGGDSGAFQQLFAKNQGSFRSSIQSLSGRSKASNTKP